MQVSTYPQRGKIQVLFAVSVRLGTKPTFAAKQKTAATQRWSQHDAPPLHWRMILGSGDDLLGTNESLRNLPTPPTAMLEL